MLQMAANNTFATFILIISYLCAIFETNYSLKMYYSGLYFALDENIVVNSFEW